MAEQLFVNFKNSRQTNWQGNKNINNNNKRKKKHFITFTKWYNIILAFV